MDYVGLGLGKFLKCVKNFEARINVLFAVLSFDSLTTTKQNILGAMKFCDYDQKR